MENSPVKKKKKYVRKVVEGEKSEISEASDKVSSNSSALEKYPFRYSFDEIVNHILAKILPDNRFILDISNQLIIGKANQVDDILKKLANNIIHYTGFIIELEEGVEREDIEYDFQEAYGASLFGIKLIEKLITEIFKDTKLQCDCNSFLKMFKSESDRLFVRMMRNYEDQFLDKIQKKAKPLLKVGISNKQVARGNRKNLKVELASATIDSQAFDSKKWKEFISKSNKIEDKDIEIIENKNQYGKTESFTIKLACNQSNTNQIKIECFNYYFKFQDFVRLPSKDSEHKTQIIKQYSNFQKSWLTIKLLKGYKSSKWDDKTLIYKIRTNNISTKKTNFTNEQFQGFLLIGIFPKVIEYFDQINYEMNNVPLDDVREELFLDMDQNTQDALRSCQAVHKFIEEFITEYAANFANVVKLINVKFIQRSVKLNLLLMPGKEKQYEDLVKKELESILTKEISVRQAEMDFDVDEQCLQKLQNESIIVVSYKNNWFKYIARQSKITEIVPKIQQIKRELEGISQEEIMVKGKAKLNKYMEQIKALKCNSKYEDIFIAEPQTKDKINYRIPFIGSRKKNAEFIILVNQKIAQIEKGLGSYQNLVSEQQANFLIQDNEIQEKLLKDYNMSIVVDLSHSAEAILDIMPQKPSKCIFFFKSKNLSIVPIDYKVFFVGRDQLDIFNEKYLEILKMKSKRFTKNEPIKESEPNRRLQFYYKLSMTTQELVEAALQQQQQNKVCLFLPKQQKQKFVKDLLTILTRSNIYDGKSYEIMIINTSEDDDIKGIINLPEFDCNKKEEIVIQWSCEGRPYSKLGNNKINDAISKGRQSCIITEDDINDSFQRTNSSFICDLDKKVITAFARRGTQQLPLIIEKDCIKFVHKGVAYQLSSKQYNLVRTYQSSFTKRFYIKLVYYLLDLKKETQTNIFSGKTRKLQKNEKVLHIQGEYKEKVHAFYDQNTPSLIFSFEERDSKKLPTVVEEVQTYIASKIITSFIKLKPISEKYKAEVKKMITSKAEESEVNCTYDQFDSSVTVSGLNEKNIQRYQRIIQSQMEYLLMLQKMGNTVLVKQNLEFKYPMDWRPQKQDIQTFVIDPNSQEFQDIQKLFTVKPIAELVKIQNKYLYKKYSDEVDHLTYLNKNKRPKEMMLFHGTRSANPKIIWEDKEEGFNINYSADVSLLGRGLYFAEKSEYSYHYMYSESALIGSMFLCKVIVGESQVLEMTSANSHLKDTIIKDNVSGIRFESMKGKHDICDIYVVFKDKRAYPAYLIKFRK